MSNSQMNTWVGFFNGATSFNQDLRAWCASNISSEPSDFSTSSALIDSNKPVWGTCAPSVTLTDTDANNIVTGFIQAWYYPTANYDLLLVAYDALNLQNGVLFRNHAFYSGCSPAEAARQNMIDTDNWTFNDRGPTACSTMAITSSTVSDGATSNNSTLAMTFTASASTSNFVVGDITVSGGALSSFSGSGTTYTATFTPSGQGATTIDVASGVFTDSSSRHNDAATQFNWTYDSSSPTTTFSPANSATAVAVASDITLTFNEAVRLINNSALDDSNVDALITLKENNSSGADIAFNATINGGKTVITINPDSNLSSTQVVYVAIGATVEDAANNAINAANVSFTTADVSAPTMTITSAEVSDGASSNDSTLAMTFTSSEATSNFVVGDISVNGGALSSFNATSTTVYTATFTPSGDGAKTIDVAGGAFTDSSSNNNSAATQFNWTYNSSSPTMAITSAEVSDGASSNDSTLAMTFTSSEATSNFVVGDISVNGGALSSFNGTSSTVYTATFTPSGDGAKTIDVAAGAFTDSSSNNNSGSNPV